jgi:hypothetical protein
LEFDHQFNNAGLIDITRRFEQERGSERVRCEMVWRATRREPGDGGSCGGTRNLGMAVYVFVFVEHEAVVVGVFARLLLPQR